MTQIAKTILDPSLGLAVRATVPLDELQTFFGRAFEELTQAVHAGGALPADAPFARYHSAPPAPLDVEAILPVDVRITPTGRARLVELEGGPALQLLHVGPYDGIGAAYAELARWMEDHGVEAAAPPREVYLTSPTAVPDPAAWQTLVVQPIRPRDRSELH